MASMGSQLLDGTCVRHVRPTLRVGDEVMAEVATDIKEIGDRLSGLTIKQAVDLKNYLKEAYGIEPAAGGAVMMAGPGGGGAAVAEPVEEKTTFDVVLKGG